MYKPVCIGCKFDVKYRHCVILACNTRMYHTDTSFCIHTGTAISYDSLLLSCLRYNVEHRFLVFEHLLNWSIKQHTFTWCNPPQLWTVILWLSQPMARLVTLLEQHLDGQPPTVVIQDMTWWETTLACVKLQECGQKMHLSVMVCSYWSSTAIQWVKPLHKMLI